ncbi:MAG: hypothetical protein MUP81_04590 [Dehalococcoidia bacterium]|nr:hypothetical protein [Dehalococcoidia bacterium]
MGVFGNTTEGTVSLSASNDILGCHADSPASDGVATKLSVYQRLWGAGEVMIGGLYNAADNSLVASTETVSGSKDDNTWIDLPFASPVTVYSAISYYCAILVPSTSSINVYSNNETDAANRPLVLNGGDVVMPETITVSSSKTQYEIYCTYTAETILGLAGIIAGVSTVEGAIGANPVTVPSLGGTIAGVSAITGAIGENPVTVPSLAGTIAGVSTVSGAVSKEEIAGTSIAGTIAGISSISGEITVGTVLYLAGIIAAVSAITGALSLWKAAIGFPSSRPAGYDADKVFDEDTGTWTTDADLLTKDGSRHKTQLVMVGMDLIYYEAI